MSTLRPDDAPVSRQATVVPIAVTLPGRPAGTCWTAAQVTWVIRGDEKYQHIHLMEDPRRPGQPRMCATPQQAERLVDEIDG